MFILIVHQIKRTFITSYFTNKILILKIVLYPFLEMNIAFLMQLVKILYLERLKLSLQFSLRLTECLESMGFWLAWAALNERKCLGLQYNIYS